MGVVIKFFARASRATARETPSENTGYAPEVTSIKKAVDMEMIGSDAVLDGTNHTPIYTMGSFSGDVTITRIGIQGKIITSTMHF